MNNDKNNIEVYNSKTSINLLSGISLAILLGVFISKGTTQTEKIISVFIGVSTFWGCLLFYFKKRIGLKYLLFLYISILLLSLIYGILTIKHINIKIYVCSILGISTIIFELVGLGAADSRASGTGDFEDDLGDGPKPPTPAGPEE